MLRLLLAAAVLAVVAGQDAVPVPGLSDWCQLPGHASTSACASDATCATGDSWWSDASICKLPGPAGQYPYNVSSYDVCGGPGAVTRVPLVDPSGAQLGEAALFRLYASTQLHVTVALGTNDSAVALYRPADGAGTGALASLFLDQSLLPGPAAQYSSLVPSSGTSPYACFTWSLDLTAVCDPLTSYQGGDGSCVCYSGAQCPPQDLSAEEVLYFFLTLNVTLAQPGADGCRTDTGTVTTLTTSFPAASVPGTGQTGSIPVGPVRTGCSQPAPPPGTQHPAYPPIAQPSPAAAASPPNPPPPSPPPAPPSPPAPADGPWATVRVLSPLANLTQAEGCSQAVMQLYPLYRGAASSFDCRAAPNSLGIGSDLSFRLVFQSYDGLGAFRQGMSDEKTWEGLLGALAVSCGSLGAYEDSLGEAYSVCGAAGEAPACRYVLPALRCAPPPPPPPARPPPAACTTSLAVLQASAPFVYASCDELLWFNTAMFMPGVAAAAPFRCALAPSRDALSIHGVLASPAAAERYLDNARNGVSIDTLARYFNLTCADTIAFNSSACVPEGGVITYTQQSLPASVCPRPPAPPPAPPSPPPPRPPRPPQRPPRPPEFPGTPAGAPGPPPASPVEPDGGPPPSAPAQESFPPPPPPPPELPASPDPVDAGGPPPAAPDVEAASPPPDAPPPPLFPDGGGEQLQSPPPPPPPDVPLQPDVPAPPPPSAPGLPGSPEVPGLPAPPPPDAPSGPGPPPPPESPLEGGSPPAEPGQQSPIDYTPPAAPETNGAPPGEPAARRRRGRLRR
ncbi:hypothetical protein HYH03_009047 [Edaphochlamys debaryana]|uniref:LysM domain-containing protein n=1 Tax=Edaphochlamys debaryana TaxID=47281 RepID=A0A835XYN1_9CHLO|nr:hypothetical protein HYH03_009047 [Edaphochlamys debaryana]|eukprot:KAG2492631.1 hypothetical protein HYH03_009047 [Edaphochlamys debaryana]